MTRGLKEHENAYLKYKDRRKKNERKIEKKEKLKQKGVLTREKCDMQ